ncbi:hypothetical protein PVAP13_7KG283755 [Panicum virgatum]|uniref:Uncharacterized protein n=1 Tax=Panicum virgatum TaxID=38727 RepID=A0A8T0QJK9_PANVG|nr:hypothetical protein PVAP13_7KG283755 [Panicum virgatum]
MAFLDDGRMKVPLPPCSSHDVTGCFSVPLDACHCTHYPPPMLPARFPSSIRSRAGTSSRLWRIHQEMFLCKWPGSPRPGKRPPWNFPPYKTRNSLENTAEAPRKAALRIPHTPGRAAVTSEDVKDSGGRRFFS